MENKNYDIDNLDLQILSILMEDAKVPYTKIGEVLFVSPGTVHVRMKKMEQMGRGCARIAKYKRVGEH